jgi:uncharacterized protein YbjQ (UPF0145 family)
MKNLNNLLVTTTSTIEGMIIKQYLKPISAHVVAGTNLFSDFFASLSDEFGGRSKTYQRQLSSLYQEAVEILKQTAYELGANCILALKVDIDEISGKGKQMFMITATGTAVRIDNVNKIIDTDQTQNKLEVLNLDKMIELRKRKSLIQLAIDNQLELNETTWEFLIQNKVNELSRQVLDIVKINYSNALYQMGDKLYQNLTSYLSVLEENERTTLIYDYLLSPNVDQFSAILYRIINDLMIFDSVKLEKYLQDKDVEIKNKALQIIVTDKPFFTKDDIKAFESLIHVLDHNFHKTSKNSTMKKLLSSKEIDIWICQCDHKNEISLDYCGSCGKDPYGFIRGQVNPDLATKKLRENISLIQNYVA